MDDRAKLKHLAAHWGEHNRDHVDTYRIWADKMKASGEDEVSAVLEEIANRTSDLDQLFHNLLTTLQ